MKFNIYIDVCGDFNFIEFSCKRIGVGMCSAITRRCERDQDLKVMYKTNGIFYLIISSPDKDFESWKCSDPSKYEWNDTHSYEKENHKYSAIVLKLKPKDWRLKIAWCNKTKGK